MSPGPPLPVTLVRAPNPGPLTGPGTNTWIVGREELVVVDPGPLDASHLDAVVAAAAPLGRISRIVCTHHHPDHREGALALAARTETLVGVFHSTAQAPAELPLRDGDRIEAGAHHLRCVHTPGHAADHLCLLAEDDGACFFGDHLLGGMTTVIDPPDGNLGTYLRSLDRLQALRPRIGYPGHGPILADPVAEIATVRAHRLEREAQIVAALAALAGGPATPAALVPGIYRAYPETLWPAAARTVLAHLEKLAEEGRVVAEPGPAGTGETFRLSPGAATGGGPGSRS